MPQANLTIANFSDNYQFFWQAPIPLLYYGIPQLLQFWPERRRQCRTTGARLIWQSLSTKQCWANSKQQTAWVRNSVFALGSDDYQAVKQHSRVFQSSARGNPAFCLATICSAKFSCFSWLLLLLREALLREKMFSFGHCPKREGGETPARICWPFFHHIVPYILTSIYALRPQPPAQE